MNWLILRLRALRVAWGYRYPARYRVVWVALAGLLAVSAISVPEVFHRSSLQVVTALAGVLVLASLGQLFVVMSGGLDLSVPAVMTLTGAIAVKQAEHGMAVVVALVVGCALLIGLVNGVFVAVTKLNPLIVTLATGGVVAGGTVLWAGVSFSASGTVVTGLSAFAHRAVGPVSLLLVCGLVLSVLLAGLLGRTTVGRAFVATGTNPVAARIVGLRVTAHRVFAYTAGALLYAVAGLLLAGFLRSPDLSMGAAYQLTSVIAVALAGATIGGGPASVLGVVAAGAFLGLLDQFLTLKNMPAGIHVMVQGASLVAAVAAVTALPWITERWRLTFAGWRSATSLPSSSTSRAIGADGLSKESPN